MFDQWEEHRDFYYDSPASQAEFQAQACAIEKGDERPWILTDMDYYVPNPNYVGPPVPPPDLD